MKLIEKTADIDKVIGAIIRKERIACGMSQDALAGELGVTFQQVQKYEKGRNRVAFSTFFLICSALKVGPNSAFGAIYSQLISEGAL